MQSDGHAGRAEYKCNEVEAVQSICQKESKWPPTCQFSALMIATSLLRLAQLASALHSKHSEHHA